MSDLINFIHAVPDFPEKGVIFRDISPLLAQKFPETIENLAKIVENDDISSINGFAGVDSRGFIFASALAQRFSKQMILIRKADKLPPPTVRQSYALEYGQATLEMKPGGGRIILVDDVLATGGTLAAAADLCVAAGYDVAGLLALIDLRYLNNFEWNGLKCRSLFQFD